MPLAKPSSCAGCPLHEPPFGKHEGFSRPDGRGDKGVLIVAEALGADEEAVGTPLVGKSGFYLFSALARVGLVRDDFTLFNTIACRPPNNKLVGESWADAAIAHCAPNLDAVIARMKEQYPHFVILTLGLTAFKRVMGVGSKDPLLKEDFHIYPHWSPKYQCYVVATFHPSFLMRGNSHLLPTLQFAATRAVEIAELGLKLEQPDYLLDPAPPTFQQWVNDYLEVWKRDPQHTFLSYDIETPHKQGKSEEEITKEEGEDYTILRCSFSYHPGAAVSVPWNASYYPMLEQLFGHEGQKVGWNNQGYDNPRIVAQMPLRGDNLDAMLAWHVLNSAMPKGLGFVTPFYAQRVGMWKHLSQTQPAYYNAADADRALRNFLGIKADLIKNGQWPVFERHVVQLNRVLGYMSAQGVLRDEPMRREAEVKLQGLLDGVEAQMESAVPQAARRISPKHGYKKVPTDTTGKVLISVQATVRRCAVCGVASPTKTHFKARKKTVNPCAGGSTTEAVEAVERWAQVLDFKVSKVGLTNYQKALKHSAIIDRRENKVTFDETALNSLIKKYPKDPLYPLILEQRGLVKLLSTYIGVTQENGVIRGGMPVGKDGRIRTIYTHNPSTLRLSSQAPNLQNCPRAKGPNDLQTIIRNLIMASPGCILGEADFAAIEGVLTGYFAGDVSYIRLAKLGIHSYLASHVLGRPADLRWDDDHLRCYFREIKKSVDPRVMEVYNGSKVAVHSSSYGATPRKLFLVHPEVFPTTKFAEHLQDIFFSLFPAIRRWQLSTQLQAEKDGYLRNPFNYCHRFSRIFTYAKEGGKWVRKQGDDANAALAFLPQSTAAGIIKEAMLRLYFQRFEEAGQYLRLQVHDSLVCDIPVDVIERVRMVVQEEMTKPIPELRLPTSYDMGPMLAIDVEWKQGPRWGEMH